MNRQAVNTVCYDEKEVEKLHSTSPKQTSPEKCIKCNRKLEKNWSYHTCERCMVYRGL